MIGVDPIEGGNATDYDYCTGDPINCFDLDGQWGIKLPKINVKKWWRDHGNKVKAGVALASIVCTACAAVGAAWSLYDGYKAARRGDVGGALLGVAGAASFGYGRWAAKGLARTRAPIRALSRKAGRLARRGKSYSKAHVLAHYEDEAARFKSHVAAGAAGDMLSSVCTWERQC